MKIFYFGNPHLDEDNSAIKICERLRAELKNDEFKQIDNTFQLFDENLEGAVLIDVVQGLDKVREIKPEQLEQGRITSLHDFDLAFFLKLKKQKARIIGIPQDYSRNIKETGKIIKKLLS